MTGRVPLPDDDEVDVKRIVDRSISRGTLRPRGRSAHPSGSLSRGSVSTSFPMNMGKVMQAGGIALAADLGEMARGQYTGRFSEAFLSGRMTT